ncbi:MAG: glycoside hydrolase family 28 protein [Mangrovibacterium sp.]|tara:strand:- start:6784 stop:8109 length:1326 start_codon:yes stop_codon:yes gene_type:complete
MRIYKVLIGAYVLMIHIVCSGNVHRSNDEDKALFPDGTPIPEWFSKTEMVDVDSLGKKYVITDYGVKNDSESVQTIEIQHVIDSVSENGGGVIVIPKGVFISGSLFFKPKTHLYLAREAILKGSNDISDFEIVTTRIEGQSLAYFAALVNADQVDRFTISGKGTIDGNGLRFWKAFWLRRQWNPQCTNLEEQRPRLLFVSNSNDVQVSGIRLMNSPFWTSHYYKCNNLKILNLHICAPTSGVKAPSSDAIDLDVCQNVLIKNCYLSVNDDAVCLKGGKGPLADKDPNNGTNRNIIIEDNVFENCPALTLGSESVHTYNVVMRRCSMRNTHNILLLKMRPDTPQNHEYILVEDITGTTRNFLNISPWTQFFNLRGLPQPKSKATNIVMRNCKVDCDVFLNVKITDQYHLSNFVFENLDINTEQTSYDTNLIKESSWTNVNVK